MIPVFIVEGWSDHDKLQNALGRLGQLDTIVTNGIKLNNRIRDLIELHERAGNNLFILSDPDEAGDHLARMVNSEYPSMPRIPVDPSKATYRKGVKNKYGVEYCSHKYLQELLGGYINVM